MGKPIAVYAATLLAGYASTIMLEANGLGRRGLLRAQRGPSKHSDKRRSLLCQQRRPGRRGANSGGDC